MDAAYIFIIIPIILIALIIIAIIYRFYQKFNRLRGIENIFKDSAERLEAGEEFGPIIINAYNFLINHLKKYGYLQRGSETFREFETAVTSALPINKEAFNKLIIMIEKVQYSNTIDFEDLRPEAISTLRSLEKNVFIIREDEQAAIEKVEKEEESKKSAPVKSDESMNSTELKEKLRVIMEKYPENKTFEREKVRAMLEKTRSSLPKLPKDHDFKDIIKLETAYEEFPKKTNKKLYSFYLDFIDSNPDLIRSLDIKPGCVTYLIECIAMTNELPLVKKQAVEDDVLLALKIAILMAQGHKQDFITPDHLKGALLIVLNGAITLKKLKETKKISVRDIASFILEIMPVPYVHDIVPE